MGSARGIKETQVFDLKLSTFYRVLLHYFGASIRWMIQIKPPSKRELNIPIYLGW